MRDFEKLLLVVLVGCGDASGPDGSDGGVLPEGASALPEEDPPTPFGPVEADPSRRFCRSESEVLGTVTIWTYDWDDAGRRIRDTGSNQHGGKELRRQFASGQLVEVRQLRAGELSSERRFVYDSAHRLVREEWEYIREQGPNATDCNLYAYDEAGVRVAVDFDLGCDGSIHQHAQEIRDENGRLLEVRFDDGATPIAIATYTRGADGRLEAIHREDLSGDRDEERTFLYDEEGRLVTDTLFYGYGTNITSYEYDAEGRPIRATLQSGPDLVDLQTLQRDDYVYCDYPSSHTTVTPSPPSPPGCPGRHLATGPASER